MSQILVVDDSLLVRKCVAELLEQDGHTVMTAADGREAWVMLYAGLPDLVVLDLMMPQMSGLTFLRMLRHNHHWNQLPVLVLTGLSIGAEWLEETRSLGVEDILTKGEVSAEQILEHIAACLPAQRDARNKRASLARR